MSKPSAVRTAVFDVSYRLGKTRPPAEVWVKMRGDNHPGRWLGFGRTGQRSEIHVRINLFDGERYLRQDRIGVNEIPECMLTMVEASLPDLLDCLIARLEGYVDAIEAMKIDDATTIMSRSGKRRKK